MLSLLYHNMPSRRILCFRRSRLRTHDLRFWRPPLYQLSYTPWNLFYFCFLMERMLAVVRAIFHKLQFFLDITLVFAGCIIAPFAFCALKSDQFYRCFFACHSYTSRYGDNPVYFNIKKGKNPCQPSIRIELMTSSLPWMCSTD